MRVKGGEVEYIPADEVDYFDVPPLRARHRALDALLLEVIRDEPRAALRVFERLFARNTPARILAFLDEATTTRDELALILTLPPGPFLRALGRRLRQRVRGQRVAR